MYGLTPAGVDGLTFAEIAVLLRPGDQRGPPTGRDMSEEEILAEAARWAGLRPLEKLLDARRQRGDW